MFSIHSWLNPQMRSLQMGRLTVKSDSLAADQKAHRVQPTSPFSSPARLPVTHCLPAALVCLPAGSFPPTPGLRPAGPSAWRALPPCCPQPAPSHHGSLSSDICRAPCLMRFPPALLCLVTWWHVSVSEMVLFLHLCACLLLISLAECTPEHGPLCSLLCSFPGAHRMPGMGQGLCTQKSPHP